MLFLLAFPLVAQERQCPVLICKDEGKGRVCMTVLIPKSEIKIGTYIKELPGWYVKEANKCL